MFCEVGVDVESYDGFAVCGPYRGAIHVHGVCRVDCREVFAFFAIVGEGGGDLCAWLGFDRC